MNYSIVDIETDGLLDELTLIHCICAEKHHNGNVTRHVYTDYPSMINFLLNEEIIIGHSFIRFDVPAIEKVLNIQLFGKVRIIDSLPISWYLFPERNEHGLEFWGEEFGVPKPAVKDWSNQPLEVYVHRCNEDVTINSRFFDYALQKMKRIYSHEMTNMNVMDNFIRYLTFKMMCAKEQEDIRWKVDLVKCRAGLEELETEMQIKVARLKMIMPRSNVYKKVKKPVRLSRKNGELTVIGENWFYLLGKMNLPITHEEPVKVLHSTEDPNPNSPEQVKSWLYSLGWIPETFRFEKEDNGTVRKIPQINTKDNGICPSIKKLYPIEPGLSDLEGVGILSHRMGILKGFLEEADENGYVQAKIAGLTNTLRFKHKMPCVNLPTVQKPYGALIRGCLTCESHQLLCGSDMSSLEDSTKHHYMYFFDPEYVTEMRKPDFDAHIDIGLQGGMLTEDEANFYKWMDGKPVPIEKVNPKYLSLSEEERKSEFKRLSAPRKDAKVVNFSAVYGVGAPKMSLTTGWELGKSKEMLEIYWERNQAVKKVAKSCIVQYIDNEMWLYNPVSGFWYSLRYEKDRFSTLNQSTGVYCFDTWIKYNRQAGIKMCGQFHDEIAFPLLKEDKEKCRQILLDSIDKANKELKLNVTLSVSIAFGENYSDIH